MVSSSFKTRQLLNALERIGFTRRPKRGKGDHIWFFRLLTCSDGECVVQTFVDSGPKMVSPGDLRRIKDAIGLTEDQLAAACSNTFTAIDYEALTIERKTIDYLPPFWREIEKRRSEERK